jgi:ribosome-associated toxin RatA of RatAB toxin-antitoxin module
MGSESIKTEVIILGKVRRELAWKIITDYENYPKIIKNIDQVEILEKHAGQGKSRWFINLQDTPLLWIEKDFYDRKNYEIRFESIDGDFKKINGRWKIEEYQNQGIKLYYEIDYNLGVPVIENVFGHILKNKMETNINYILSAIKRQLVQQQVEGRKYRRFKIAGYNALLINNEIIQVYIINISRGGIWFCYETDFSYNTLTITLGEYQIEAKCLYNDISYKNTRLIFKQPLSKTTFANILEKLSHKSTHMREFTGIQ